MQQRAARQALYLDARQGTAIGLDGVILEGRLAVDHVRIADHQVARAHGIGPVSDTIPPFSAGDVQQVQNPGMLVQHVGVLLAVKLLDIEHVPHLDRL